MFKKIWVKNKSFSCNEKKFNALIAIVSLIITIVSLIISIVALKVSNRTLDLSTISFSPQFEYKFYENNDFENTKIEVYNPYYDLFEIKMILVYEIKTIGIEHKKLNGIISLPFLTVSKIYREYNSKSFGEKVLMDLETIAPCSDICAFDDKMYNSLLSKYKEKFDLNSKEGYLLPVLQTKVNFVEVYYLNKNKEKKSTIFRREHIRGFPEYDEEIITQNELDSVLSNSIYQDFESIKDFENYAFKKYFSEY
ncbi:hypothetical protein [Sphingobacterium sp.]|uniref:hypothetical protein n=1 Tax=Sphingobacterium sp. TaxID=341027 RepID=UPI0028B133DA|nr:hypothetical protein [Sphingobacterium sp.]